MNSASTKAALFLTIALVAGCSHKAKTAPPPAAQAPITPVSQSAKNVPPPSMPPPELPSVGQPAPENTAPPPKPKKTVHHKPKPGTPATTGDQPSAAQAPAKDQATTEQASNGATSDISPIGQLTAAGASTDTPKRHDILDEINATEKGLNDIKRPLSSDEQTTATQIKTFLTKAKDALSQEDLDGASTLVTKAKVLLAELTKQ